jgi:hypothetical protein
MKRKVQKPPYKSSLTLKVRRSDVTVRLPRASDYKIGQRTEVQGTFKNLSFTVHLIRVEGGWDVEEK